MKSRRGVQDSARVILKVRPGLTAFLTGLDKFFRLFEEWPGYRTSHALAVRPVSPNVFIMNPQATARLPRGKMRRTTCASPRGRNSGFSLLLHPCHERRSPTRPER